ncbi:single-stranded-DNA-specific exonuclease RecJ [bacterium]|nr:single-stranded-DNA-specific exonuclease RecJ [bacterium]
MKRRQWREESWDQPAVDSLAAALGVHPIVAGVLWLRGLRDAPSAERFVFGKTPELHSPSLLPDIVVAVERLRQARERRERILVHGDYDVDGVAGTTLLYDLLRRNGWCAAAHVPHRTDEGYGVSSARLQEAALEGVTLVLTVDCGTSAVEEVEAARGHGMDVIITDHHRPPERLPAALAHVNPQRTDSAYPNPHLSGTGVAYKLAVALAEAGVVPREEAERHLDLVALGTVADMMPLFGENRDLVRAGLRAFSGKHRPGLAALAESCRVKLDSISTDDIAFFLAPRLNAAGRLADPRLALDLLTSTSGEEAVDLVSEVEHLNADRKAREQAIQKQAYQMLEEDPELAHRETVVLAHRDWHRGVVGLVAARLAESLHRPVAVLAIEGETACGSARAAGKVDVTAALAQCQGLLDRYGGHEAAAGFQLPVANLPAFRDAFEMAVVRSGVEIEPMAGLTITRTLEPAQITRRLVTDLSLLEPYGCGHPRPIFALRDVDLRSRAQTVGNGHLKVYAPMGTFPGQAEKLDMIGFGKGTLLERLDWESVDVAFELGWNQFRGETTVQLKLVDVRDHERVEVDANSHPTEARRGEVRLLDYRSLPRVRRSFVPVSACGRRGHPGHAGAGLALAVSVELAPARGARRDDLGLHRRRRPDAACRAVGRHRASRDGRALSPSGRLSGSRCGGASFLDPVRVGRL